MPGLDPVTIGPGCDREGVPAAAGARRGTSLRGHRAPHSRGQRDRGAVLSRLILDTTFLVDAERAGNGVDWVIREADDVAIAAIVLAERKSGSSSPWAGPDRTEATFSTASWKQSPSSTTTLGGGAHARLLVAVRRQGRPRGAAGQHLAARAVASNRVVVTAHAGAFDDLPDVTVQPHR